MPRKKTTPATPPEDMRQDLADDLVKLKEDKPELFSDADPAEEEPTPPQVQEPDEVLDPAEPDFVMVDSEEAEDEHVVIDQAPDLSEILAQGRATTLLHALQKLVADEIYIATKERKVEVLSSLLKIWDATGSQSFEVVVPTVDGTEEKVGTVSLTGGKEGGVEIADEDEFLDWLEANRPELVKWVEHEAQPARPAMPAYSEPTIPTGVLKKLSKALKVLDDGSVMDTGTGEVVPGLAYGKRQPPDNFKVTWGGAGSPGRHRAMDLLKSNQVAGHDLHGIVPMPEIEE